MILTCPICGKLFNCYPSRLEKNKSQPCCSRECSIKLKQQLSLNCTCDYCGKKFHKKQSHIDKCQYNYCSEKCLAEHRKIIYKGKNNPNAFCRIPENNKRLHCGYYWIYLPSHPFATKDGYIREHRLIAEQYLLTEEFSIEIDGKLYLSPDFEVHHKDLNKLNNDPLNLQILSKSDHQKLHGEIKRQALQLYKKIGVEKSRN